MQISNALGSLLTSNTLEMDLKGVSNELSGSEGQAFDSALSALMGNLPKEQQNALAKLISVLEGSEEEGAMAGMPQALAGLMSLKQQDLLSESNSKKSSLSSLELKVALETQAKHSSSDVKSTPVELALAASKPESQLESSPKPDLNQIMKQLTKTSEELVPNDLGDEMAAQSQKSILSRMEMSPSESKSEALMSSLNESQQKKSPLSKSSLIDDFAKQLSIQKDLGFSSVSKLIRDMPQVDGAKSSSPMGNQIQQNFFEDMRVHLAKMVKNEAGGSVTLQLRPGNLGRVEIQVDVQGESVRVEMRAEEKGGEQALRGTIGELRSQLQSAGLKVDDLSLQTFKGQQEAQNHHESRGHQHSQKEAYQDQATESESNEELVGDLAFEDLLTA